MCCYQLFWNISKISYKSTNFSIFLFKTKKAKEILLLLMRRISSSSSTSSSKNIELTHHWLASYVSFSVVISEGSQVHTFPISDRTCLISTIPINKLSWRARHKKVYVAISNFISLLFAWIRKEFVYAKIK